MMNDEKFDPEVEALKNRRQKVLHVTLELDPSGASKPVVVNQELVDGMVKEGQDVEDAEAAKQLDSDKASIEESAMGGESPEQILENFEGKSPRSLGERVKLDLAKKKKTV
jgi:hypothetical protein